MLKSRIASFVFLLIALVSTTRVFAQTTAFVYQGQLQNSGTPANGNHDFEFALFDSLSGGAQLGATLPQNSVAVTSGIFAVSLDFGASFPGASRFLEIRVRQSGGGALTTLSPRQPITSVPYSVKSLTADNAANSTNAVNATNANTADTAATATNALSLGGVAAGGYLQTNGNGSGLTNLNATNITTGTLSNARLGQIPSANIADSAVTAPKIASGQVVKSINTLKDDVTLAAGSNITITPAGNTLTIASTGSSGCASPCTAAIFNATQQYNFGGNRVLAAPGSNTYLGVTAGTNNTSGILNSFFGAGAGEQTTTGSGNSFFGGGSGQDNVNGSDNSFFGGNTGRGNASGSRNSFFGRLAGRFNGAGNDNTFLGYNAGNSTGGGTSNTYVGSEAGEANTGSQNAFFGQSAGKAVSAGSQNSFFGEAAGIVNNSGNSNSFFGRRSGDSNTDGDGNSFFGVFSGDGNTTGNNNVFIGGSAGTSNTSGTNNTIIGANANVGSSGLTNAAAIGANAVVSQSNSLVLGNNANVGIGTSLPSAKLHVSGAVLSSGSAGGVFIARNPTDVARDIQFGWLDDVATILVERPAAGSNAFRIRNRNGGGFSTNLFVDDNVGIGTESPSSRLHVVGNVRLTPASGGDTHLCIEGGVVSTCGSSLRYKTDIGGFMPGLELLNRLRPVSFRWKKSGMADIGLVAEEVAEVEPLLATHNEKGEVEGVKYDRIGVVLVNAVKEQQTEIGELRAVSGEQARKIEDQSSKIKAQQKQIDALTRLVCASNRDADICKEH